MQIRTLLFLAALYPIGMTAQLVVHDPGIPGIAIGKPTDPVNAGKFAIINQSSQQVIGYQVSYTYPMGTVIKIAQDGLNVPYEGIAPGTADLIGGSPAGGTPKEIDIDWIVFADGSFYGSEKDASALETRANTRRKFFTEVSTAAHPDDYIDRYMNCKSIECMDGMNKREWGELKQAILSYRINQRGHGAKFPEVLKSYVKAHASYPRKIIRKTQNSASTAKPKDEEDGWEILNWSGTCNAAYGTMQQWGTYDAFNTGLVEEKVGAWNVSLDSTDMSSWCQYISPVFKSVVDVLLPLGDMFSDGTFLEHVSAECYNPITGGDFRISPTFGQGSPIGSYDGIPFLTTDPRYFPYYRAQTFIANDWSPAWAPSSVYFSSAFGFPEPFENPNADYGDMVYSWLAYLPPYGDFTNNSGDLMGRPLGESRTGFQGLPIIPLLENGDNTTDLLPGNLFGYIVQNFIALYQCETGNKTATLGQGMAIAARTIDVTDNLAARMIAYELATGIHVEVPTTYTTPLIYNPGEIDLLVQVTERENLAGVAPDPTDPCACISTYGLSYCVLIGIVRYDALPFCGGQAMPGSTPALTSISSGANIQIAAAVLPSTSGAQSTDDGSLLFPVICNVGYVPEDGVCLSPCPNNVAPDSYGNCIAPGPGCVMVGLGLQQCGNTYYGGCTAYDENGNCVAINQSLSAERTSQCTLDPNTGFYDDPTGTCPGGNKPGCYNQLEQLSSLVSEIVQVCPYVNPGCGGNQYWDAYSQNCIGCQENESVNGDGTGCVCDNGMDPNANCAVTCSDGSQPDQYGNCGQPPQDCSGSCYWNGYGSSICPDDGCGDSGDLRTKHAPVTKKGTTR